MKKLIALRIDADTLRGTGKGVPRLCEILDGNRVKGTFYFSVGPDNMGRHLWRLFKPAFLWKMLRTNAAGLYGPEILLMGTAWRGPDIGRHHAEIIRQCAAAGHEPGVHAWDHHHAQSSLLTMSSKALRNELSKGLEKLNGILSTPVKTSAAPGWRADARLLRMKLEFPLDYDSDCRGYAPFFPVVDGEKLPRLQIPVTLPTYDEVLGRNGVTDENYNDFQLSLLKEDTLNVLTIHAEAEGGRCSAQFSAYMRSAIARGYSFITMKEAFELCRNNAPDGIMELAPFPGREGTLAVQNKK